MNHFLIRFQLSIIAILLWVPSVLSQPVMIDRVEPGNWWTGFQQPEVELLIYGEDIQSARVSLEEYEGVSMEKVTLVDNPNYMFVTLNISDKAVPGTLQLRFERGLHSREVLYELKERSSDLNRNQGFDSTDVIYLLMPDRFANGDQTNDEIPGMLEGVNRDNPNARHGGDIQGVIDHLQYIRDLGMTAVWFTPIFENDMPPEYGAYHGYAATDMYRVDRRYGTNEKYLELIDKAHGMGMKVIMDMIHNHVGTEHWFVKDPPTDDWIHDLSEVGTTNFRTSTVMDPYASDYDYESTVKGWFVTDMPDLNQKNELLATYLIQNTLWWIEYSGIDGIRMDTHPYPYKEYMARWAERVLEEYPNFNIVGEAWMPNTPSTAYWQTGFPSQDGYESHLPSVTDFPLYNSIARGLNEEPGWDTGISQLYFTLSQDFLFPYPMKNVIFPGNHDLDRIFTVMGEDFDKFKLAMTFVLTTRGIPQLYYGDEILLTGGGPDGLKRKDMPGGWNNDPLNAFTESGRERLARQTGLPVDEAHRFVQQLSTWRQGKEVIHSGKLTHYMPQNNLYVYFRHNAEESVMVVLNAQDAPQTLNLGRFDENIGGYTSGTDIISQLTFDLESELEVAPMQAMVIELE
ncbi:MAG: glycoside hydrolase family 13 protein [Balneolaceae bacterium]|nr:glycoside hydrolase family 13 protein [Balneolaceae bacterium]